MKMGMNLLSVVCTPQVHKSIHTSALKHFGMVWRSLSLSISTIILRGPFEEQLGKLATVGNPVTLTAERTTV